MLYMGRWNDTVADFFAEELETEGKITTNFVAFTTPVMNNWLAGGGITPESGLGHIFIFVNGTDSDVALDGIKASLSDGSGTVVYWINALSLNAALGASSWVGHFIIANVAPGTYTVNIEHDSLECDNGFVWLNETPNQFPVPVEADTVTRAGILCSDSAGD